MSVLAATVRAVADALPHAGQVPPGAIPLLPQWGHNIALRADYALEVRREQLGVIPTRSSPTRLQSGRLLK